MSDQSDSLHHPGSRQGVVVTICTYNEAENLSRLLEEIFRYLPSAHVLIVDDNSPDGTGKLADQLCQQDERVHVKHRLRERGLGTATLCAFQTALAGNYEFLINLDADFSHHPRYLPELLAELQKNQADVAIGSRYVSGGKITGWPARRHLMSRSINSWSRLWMGLKTRDCSGSYRIYRCSMLEKIDFSRLLKRLCCPGRVVVPLCSGRSQDGRNSDHI